MQLRNGGVRTLHGDRVFLNLGTHAAVPDIPGLRAAKPLTHVEALELDRLPSHLIVLGGGYVGLEFAQAFVRFGSRVTVLERGPQLLAREDKDVAEALLEFLRLDGVDVRLNVEVERVEGSSGDSVRVTLATSAGNVASGRERYPGRRWPDSQYAEHRSGQNRRLPGRAWIHSGERTPRNDGAGHLGFGRVRRQPSVHARL